MRRLILATPKFLAPEVLAGQPARSRSDLFALGIVIEKAARVLHIATPDLVQHQYLTATRQRDRPASAKEALAELRNAQGPTLPPSSNAFARSTGQPNNVHETRCEGLIERIGRLVRKPLAHLIHCIAGIRKRAWYNHLESLRDWVLTPLSSSGQNLSCPPPTMIHFSRSLCQTSARRRSPPRSMEDRSVPTAVCSFWPPPTSVLA